MEELSYVLAKDFFPVFMFAFIFFTAAYFHLAGRQHFSFSHGTAAMKFSCFSSKEIRLLCFESPTLALSLLANPRECKHRKKRRKRYDFVVVFFSLKVRAAILFPAKNTSICLWFRTCQLSYFTLVCLWCGRTVGGTVT